MPLAGSGAGTFEGLPVEGERLAGVEVARVERLQRAVAAYVLRTALCGLVEGIEQLLQGHGRWPRKTGGLGGAREGEYQGPSRGDDGVQHQLAVLAAHVALAGERPAGQYVVPVHRTRTWEDAVVDPEEADHLVGHRAHRGHRADGQGAGAEVGPGGPAGKTLGHQCPDVREPEQQVLRGRVLRQPGELTAELAPLPLVATGH